MQAWTVFLFSIQVKIMHEFSTNGSDVKIPSCRALLVLQKHGSAEGRLY